MTAIVTRQSLIGYELYSLHNSRTRLVYYVHLKKILQLVLPIQNRMKIQYLKKSTKFPKKLQIQILHPLQPSFVGPRGQTNNLYLNQFHFDAAKVHLFSSFNFFLYSKVLGAQLMSLIIEKM